MSARPRRRVTYWSRIASRRSYGGSVSWSTWSGRSSADGGFVIEFSGIGGVSPREAASAFRQRASSHTSVFGTSLIGANPPAESP